MRTRKVDIIGMVPELARLIVLEMQKINNPQSDEISTNEAHRRFGRRWVVEHTKAGNLKRVYRGNRKFYSISQCEWLREMEWAKDRETPRLID